MEDFTVFETKTELVFNKDLFRQYDFYKVTEIDTNKWDVWQLLEINGGKLSFLIRGSLSEGCLNHCPIVRIVDLNTTDYETWFKKLKIERFEFENVKEMIKISEVDK